MILMLYIVTAGKRGSVVFPDLVEKIKTLIAGKKEGVTMVCCQVGFIAIAFF